uniref:Reverse transcriptase domain-containing protein n=1 Tax=Cacopsylla melanoneura TaxID=428564 RepID=A0A8D8TWM5_9HEMI
MADALFVILKEKGIKHKESNMKKIEERNIIMESQQERISSIRMQRENVGSKDKSRSKAGMLFIGTVIQLNCYIQKALDEERPEMVKWHGIRVEGFKIDMYADDIALIAESVEELKETLETMKHNYSVHK